MILEHVYFQKKTGHNRGPPQQTDYLGSILLMKKTETIEIKNLQTAVGHNRGPPQQTYYLGSILLMKKN